MEVGVGMKLPRHEVVELPGARGEHKGQTVDNGVDEAGGSNGGTVVDIIYARNC